MTIIQDTGGTGSTNGSSSMSLEAFSVYSRKATSVSEDRNSNYSPPIRPSGSMLELRQEHLLPSKRKRSRLHNPSAIYAINVSLKEAAEYLAMMEDELIQDDAMAAATHGMKLEDSLKTLWELRHEREDGFGRLVNVLQGTLAQEKFELWTREKCYVIREHVLPILEQTILDEQLGQAIRELRRAGLDPWKGISANPDNRA